MPARLDKTVSTGFACADQVISIHRTNEIFTEARHHGCLVHGIQGIRASPHLSGTWSKLTEAFGPRV
jgi:hypothetical protein